MCWLARVAIVRLLLRLTLAIAVVVLLLVGITSMLYHHRRSVVVHSHTRSSASSPKHAPKANSEKEIKRFEEKLHRHLGAIRKKAKQAENEKPFIKERTITMNYSEGSKTESRPAGRSFDSRSEIKEQKGGTLDVIIVEEHHEVLPYWFKQANNENPGKGRTPTSYTLVHLDAHSDFGPLSYRTSLRLFSWPQSHTDIVKLMQRNDVFIMAGISTGLIARFIWVWPDWMQEEYGALYGNHTTGLVDLGTFTYKESESETQTGMCACYNKVLKDGKASDVFLDELKRNCLYAKPELQPYTLDGVECSVKKANAPFDFVSETYMLSSVNNIIPKDTHQLPLSSVIVDIDEDYFGCENGGQILHASGINDSIIDDLNERLRPLFCPKTAQEEEALSMLIPTLLSPECVKLQKDCDLPSNLSQSSQSMCTNISEFNMNLQRLRGYAEKELVGPKLQRIIDLGFCMSFSPSTSKIALGTERNSMKICISKDTMSTTDFLFKPSRMLILKNSLNVQQILQEIDGVQQITVARSNRDGFVIRSLQKEIESNILHMIDGFCRSRHAKPNILYDSNLMYH